MVRHAGAGKSTLFQALFRIAEIEEGGSIKFDGQDISKVGLETLRKNLAIIPQNPVLYSGTVRTNLDPFKDYEDEQLWDALGRAQVPAWRRAGVFEERCMCVDVA